jgi:hypothetical protein
MDLDAVRAKWSAYSQGIHFRDEAEYRLSKEAFEAAFIDGFISGHLTGEVIGIANTAIDKAMKYDR